MSDNDSSSSMMVALVAILVIVAIGFIAFQMFPRTPDDGVNINIPVPTGSSASN